MLNCTQMRMNAGPSLGCANMEPAIIHKEASAVNVKMVSLSMKLRMNA